MARFPYYVMLAGLKQCFCNELTAHKGSSFKTIPPRIDYETPSEAAICLPFRDKLTEHSNVLLRIIDGAS